ncbi:NADH:flavin oxidoreductase/NADH oxidase family protein [Cognatishimia sp. MH4019]|uniref:NADH:flavin oxidoreductase/NADH oxidase family protein n=1 Tax=Cognatishimia sp. MH4019 TaxID=2854030 RepID=UPI001CD79246|nr:NADH:flavin oxidoreductase/NADH oxidase family protein [Cognatishimia sp. MH4019]
MSDPLAQPMTLPCGAVLPNRLVKAAMTEGLAAGDNHANQCFSTLYRRWGAGGVGLNITGNVHVDRWHLERPANLAIEDAQSNAALAALADMAAAGKENGALIVMQLNHAGRQTQKAVNPTPKSASDVGLKMGNGRFGKPTPLSLDEIAQVKKRFLNAARIAQNAGFDGVQVHAAHGYLMSQFLSPLSNRRTDAYGGSLENRARLLVEVVAEIRAACAAPFIVSVKLNSADFQKGGFSEDDSVQVAKWIEDAGCDFLEVSGGNYEQPRMFDFERKDPKAEEKRASTLAREAYFLDFVPKLRAATTIPLMVTGGFRSRAAMESALGDGVDLIGLGRPLILRPDGAADLLSGTKDRLDSRDDDLNIGRGLFGPTSPISFLRDLNAWAGVGWYFEHIYSLADGKDPDTDLSPFKALIAYDRTENRAAKALKR